MCREHRFPGISLAIRLYHPSHSARPQDYILCLYSGVAENFLPDVQSLLFCLKGSTGEHRL